MYSVSYHSFGIFGKEIEVIPDAVTDKGITIIAQPSQSDDNTSLIINIAGEPLQLRYIAKSILEIVPEPTADDEAARDLELLQEARKNTSKAKEVAT